MNHVNRIALILSFIFPGFGQISNREYMKGTTFIILQIVFIIIVFYPESTLFSLGMIAIPILWIWGMVDASRIYHNYSSEYRRTQRRRNIKLTLGIIAFGILSEAIFIPIILNLRSHYEIASEEQTHNDLSFSEIPSEAQNHPKNLEGSIDSPSNTSPNSTSLPGNFTSVNDKKASVDNNRSSSSPLPDDLESQNRPPQNSTATSEYTLRDQEKTADLSSWVVTVSVSEKYTEISKLYLELRQKYDQVQIIPVFSNPKRNAYAVVIASFSTLSEAEKRADKLRQDIPKCFVASYENPAIPVK
jgi:hypothetical protein